MVYDLVEIIRYLIVATILAAVGTLSGCGIGERVEAISLRIGGTTSPSPTASLTFRLFSPHESATTSDNLATQPATQPK